MHHSIFNGDLAKVNTSNCSCEIRLTHASLKPNPKVNLRDMRIIVHVVVGVFL